MKWPVGAGDPSSVFHLNFLIAPALTRGYRLERTKTKTQSTGFVNFLINKFQGLFQDSD